VLVVTSPALQRPGAVPAEAPDEGVAAHYGDPYREQRRLVAGEASVDLSHRGVVRVSGPDRLTWLHSLTSQHLEHLAPGEPTEALLLSPHGHVEHALAFVDDGAATWAHVEPGTAEALVRFLDSMRFWSQVEVEDLTSSHAVVLRREPVPGAVSRRVPDGVESFVRRADLSDALAGELAGIWALEALRVAAGRPRFGLETDHRTIPHEVGWIPAAVHLDKGCYRGQETVARVQNLGRPPRRLVLLHLDGSDSELPAHGDPVLLDGREVGRVTTAARHHELGPIALAVVKRATPVEADLVAGGVAARQEVLVPA
jgi:folate-binding protein YgfZ